MDLTPLHILMIEDNDGDVFLTMKALKAAKIANSVDVVHDGIEALEYLRQQGKFATAPRPDLILLDLNLPRKDGRQVLAEIKPDSQLRTIPVVVLSSSAAEQDVVKSYDLHANCYIVKPVDFVGLMQVIRSIESFWLTLVKLPHGDA